MSTKICTKCAIEKPETEFAKNGKFGRHTACKQCARDAAKEWRKNNPQIAQQKDKEKHEKNRESRLAKMREYHANNAERRSALEKARYEKKKNVIKKQREEYRKSNHHMVMAWNNARRAAEKRATPKWADYEKIADFYMHSKLMSEKTGIKHHVDHIVPLKGKNVCGLHVQNNLRVISAVENMKKGSYFASN